MNVPYSVPTALANEKSTSTCFATCASICACSILLRTSSQPACSIKRCIIQMPRQAASSALCNRDFSDSMYWSRTWIFSFNRSISLYSASRHRSRSLWCCLTSTGSGLVTRRYFNASALGLNSESSHKKQKTLKRRAAWDVGIGLQNLGFIHLATSYRLHITLTG